MHLSIKPSRNVGLLKGIPRDKCLRNLSCLLLITMVFHIGGVPSAQTRVSQADPASLNFQREADSYRASV